VPDPLTDDRCGLAQTTACELEYGQIMVQQFLFHESNPDPLASTCENLPDHNPPSPPRLSVLKPPASTGMVQAVVGSVSDFVRGRRLPYVENLLVEEQVSHSTVTPYDSCLSYGASTAKRM
jgi:hypothetical protein